MGNTWHELCEPSFQLAQSPIHFYRAHSVSIPFAESAEQLISSGPGRLEVVEVEGFDFGPEAAAAADPDWRDFVAWIAAAAAQPGHDS